jgi:hypothetical protein
MKALFISFIFALTACSSNRGQDSISSFSKEKVCSTESLAYLSNYSSKIHKTEKNLEDDIYARGLSLEPAIKKCYEDDIGMTSTGQPFYLCLVVGYSKTGAMEYFEFSNREIKFSKEFYSCLSSLKSRKELSGLKELSLIQPYRLQFRR